MANGVRTLDFGRTNTAAMATIGRRFAERTHDKQLNKVLDASTKAVLNAVLSEPRGAALDAYLRARAPGKKR